MQTIRPSSPRCVSAVQRGGTTDFLSACSGNNRRSNRAEPTPVDDGGIKKSGARLQPISLLVWMLGLCGAIFLASQATARVGVCDTSSGESRFDCTDAQQTAYSIRESLQHDTDTPIAVVNAYRNYLNGILLGYTPNDSTLQNLLNVWLATEAQHPGDDAYDEVEFRPSDVFETFDDDIDEEDILSIRTDGSWQTHRSKFDDGWPLEDITAIVQLEDCEESVCNRVTDRVVAMLGGGFSATKESRYVESGFRVTGLRNFPAEVDLDSFRGLSSYDSFGLWAQDSYWGAIWDEGYSFFDTSHRIGVAEQALFISGGRNPAKPSESGTWKGLAIGTRLLGAGADEERWTDHVRIGHSEITVRLDSSEVDVTITGIAGGLSGTVRIGDGNSEIATVSVEAVTALEWKGLSLDDNGYFADARKFGEVSTLDDVFESDLPSEGEAFRDAHDTIGGQFYGAEGAEVVGVFNKAGYVGSFGAYQE